MISEDALHALSPGAPHVRSSSLPGPATAAVLARLDRSEFADGLDIGGPIAVAGGQGVFFDDHDGNRFMDLNIMASQAYLGMGHPGVTQRMIAATERMNRAGSPKTELRAEVEEKIIATLPDEMRGGARVAFTLTGTMANEVAVRMAMRATGRRRIVAFTGCYHGIWGMMWQVTSPALFRSYDWGDRTQAVSHMPFPNCYRCPFGREPDSCGMACADFIDHMLEAPDTGVDDVACVIIEPILNSGHIKPPPGFLARLRAVCDRIGALLVTDSLANGFVVSGDTWTAAAEGVPVDIMTLGKGVANSVPLAATIFRGEVAARAGGIVAGNGGNAHPVILAAASATLDAMFDPEDELAGRGRVLEAAARRLLEPFAAQSKVVGQLRLMGFTGCIELVRDKESRAPVASGFDAGTALNAMLSDPGDPASLLMQGYPLSALSQYGNVVRWCVPLTTPVAVYEQMIRTVIAAIERNENALASGPGGGT